MTDTTDLPDRWTGDIAELLRFYAEAGHDVAMEDAPVNRFLAAEAAARPAQQRAAPVADGEQRAQREAPTPRMAAPALPDEQQAAAARALAREARTLDELREMLAAFDGCNLKFTAKSLVFGDGNPAAPIMFVGEAPGREEDMEGLPFVGRSGRLLDLMLAAMGLDRTGAYITNVIPWRPPGNRDPSPLETEICRPFIERHIELVNPKVLVTLGNPSTRALTGQTTGIMRLRGKWLEHVTPGGLKIAAMPTLHPAYLLRNPAHKKLVWRDLLTVKARLQGEA